MKQLREYIKKQLKSLNEGMVKRPLPNDAKMTLLGNLKLKKTHINGIQAIKSIKPSYRIYLNNNQSFTISDIGNGFGFKLVTINNKKYDILDSEHLSSALIASINPFTVKVTPQTIAEALAPCLWNGLSINTPLR